MKLIQIIVASMLLSINLLGQKPGAVSPGTVGDPPSMDNEKAIKGENQP